MGFAERIVQISVIVLHVRECRVQRVVTFTDLLKPYFICKSLLVCTALKHTQKLVLKVQYVMIHRQAVDAGIGFFEDGREHFAQHPRREISYGLGEFYGLEQNLNML